MVAWEYYPVKKNCQKNCQKRKNGKKAAKRIVNKNSEMAGNPQRAGEAGP
jgi:hypothetical protein